MQRTSTDEYRVPQNARIASPIFLGVGTSLQITTDFTIEDVSGVVVDGTRQLKIDFKNTGKTPLSLSGSVQLSSAEFQNNLVGPLPFTSVVIRPGILGYVLIPAPEQLTPGKWKILVSATQISTTKTREFTKDLTFKPPSVLLVNTMKGLAALVFFALFVFAVRLFRQPRSKSNEEGNKDAQVPRFPKFGKSDKAIRDIDSESAEIDALIDEILNRRASTKKLAKETVIKESAAKSKNMVQKTAAKKSTVKKSTTKASPKKREAANGKPKKSPTKKKVATKKAAQKKALAKR
jgi:hypothetical protein